MFDILGGGFFSPDTDTLVSEGGQRRGLEVEKLGHLPPQPLRRVDGSIGYAGEIIFIDVDDFGRSG